MDVATYKNVIYIMVISIGMFLTFWGLGQSGVKRVIFGIGLILAIFISMILEPENTTFRDALIALSGVAVAIIGGGALLVNLQLRKDMREREVRDRNERLLNEIIEWATDVRRYASIPDIIDHISLERMVSADRFFTLKYNGKKFLTAIKKQAIGDDLQDLLSNAIEFFDNNWQDFAGKASRRTEIAKDFDNIGETIIEKAEDLLLSNS